MTAVNLRDIILQHSTVMFSEVDNAVNFASDSPEMLPQADGREIRVL